MRYVAGGKQTGMFHVGRCGVKTMGSNESTTQINHSPKNVCFRESSAITESQNHKGSVILLLLHSTLCTKHGEEPEVDSQGHRLGQHIHIDWSKALTQGKHQADPSKTFTAHKVPQTPCFTSRCSFLFSADTFPPFQ